MPRLLGRATEPRKTKAATRQSRRLIRSRVARRRASHSYLHVQAVDENGRTEEYICESHGFTQLKRNGITSEMLQERGYDPSTVIPSAEDQIDACIPLSGDERLSCWAELDEYLMQDVTPWIPYLFDNNVVVVSDRIVAWSFDQFAGLPAIDRLALAPE